MQVLQHPEQPAGEHRHQAEAAEIHRAFEAGDRREQAGELGAARREFNAFRQDLADSREMFDEAALIKALQKQRIGGAALDVFDQEPLPAESPLWDMENVVLTPHIAGALGTPTVGIFGPGIPEKTAPRAKPGRFEAVTLRFPCSPCKQDFFKA